MKKVLVSAFVALTMWVLLAGSVSAQASGVFYVNNAYPKGSGIYDVVVHDPARDSLKLYVNDKNPTAAKVNSDGWATFTKVKLAGQQKLSFTKKSGSKYSAINYVKYVDITDGAVKLYDTPFASAQVSTNFLAKRSKADNCQITPNREQDAACTPGAVFTDVTKTMICKSGYSKSVRNVSNATKSQVYSEYGVITHTSGQYEVDHLIPLELGGSNDIANLWPEAANPTPGFHEKDRVENYLHSQVCSGKMSLTEAQQKDANLWVEIYVGMFPAATAASPTLAPRPVTTTTPAPTPATSGVVKKSSSGICHAPGTTYYDRTTSFSTYNTIDECLGSGGRLPLR